MSFLRDENARVPFAVIGVFFIIISTMVSINLTRLDIEMAKTMNTGIEINSADRTLQYARADIARIVNYAGMNALKQIGETPVIQPDNTSEYYSENIGFNKNRAKAMIRTRLNEFIEVNYMNDTFVQDSFSVNFKKLDSWDNIEIEPVKMKLDRDLDPPLLEPGEDTYKNGYETYWKVSVPLGVHLKDTGTGSVLVNEDMVVDTIITSRYPLLKDLTGEYSERLNGTNAVMTETTAFSMAYTWARGYLQYASSTPVKSGTPKNIVNNSHLALIVNGALLLDQGFVFNSVDPASIVDYVRETASTKQGKKNISIQNISLEDGSLTIDPQKDAFNSTNDPSLTEQEFNNALLFDYNATPLTDLLNNDSMPGGSPVSGLIKTVMPQVYSTWLATGVERYTSVEYGPHDGYESSHKAEDWGEPDSMQKIGSIPADDLVPGNLYGEKWKVKWSREHTWRHYYVVEYPCRKTRSYPCSDSEGNPSTCIERYWTTCSKTVYNEMTTTDHREDIVDITLKAKENSRTAVMFNYSGGSRSSMNDVRDPYISRNVDFSGQNFDPNLEIAHFLYRSGTFDPNKMSNIKNRDLSGDNVDPIKYTINAPAWVDREAKAAIDNITVAIRNDVHLDPAINYFNYPVPSELLEAARDDIIMKIERNGSRYVNKNRYMNGSSYTSTSAKVISLAREWYVDEVKHQVREKYSQGSDMIDKGINDNFAEPEKIKKTSKDAVKFLSGGMNLPFGLTMTAYHVDENGNAYPVDDLEAWNESVTLSIDQEPNYLFTDADESNKELITLGVRNFNVFGQTGLPILPAMNPWIAQMNMWKIEVQGKINRFEVQDIDNEVHPDPIFGHGAQVYVRRESFIEDHLANNAYIGDNIPIKFSFVTGTFILVPSGKTIGDKEGGIDEKSPYFDKIL